MDGLTHTKQLLNKLCIVLFEQMLVYDLIRWLVLKLILDLPRIKADINILRKKQLKDIKILLTL